jgi:hypothetical protein
MHSVDGYVHGDLFIFLVCSIIASRLYWQFRSKGGLVLVGHHRLGQRSLMDSRFYAIHSASV